MAHGHDEEDGGTGADPDIAPPRSAGALAPNNRPASDPAQRRIEEGHCSTWSVVVRAQGSGSRAQAALGELIRRYEPVVVGMVRAFGCPWNLTPEDLKQEFFSGVLARGDIQKLDRTRGVPFRSWLSVAVKRFLLNEMEKWRAEKRGNRLTDPLQFQALHGVTPELVFDRQFAEETVLHALERHRAEARDKARFDLWTRVLPGPQLDIPDLTELAAAFGRTRNGVAVEICRLRRRHQHILRELVADTLDIEPDDPAAERRIELELARLYRTLCEVPRTQVVLEDA